MSTRKWRSTRRAHYARRLVELRTSPTRFARSEAPAAATSQLRDSSPFREYSRGVGIARHVRPPGAPIGAKPTWDDVATILEAHVADVIAACNPELGS